MQNDMKSEISIKPFRECRAAAALPGSKSITNRAMILAAIAGGRTVLEGALFSRDTLIMADCLRKLGYMVHLDSDAKRIEIESAGSGIPNSSAEMDVGNAGTVARFVTAFVALRKGGNYLFTCDGAMRARPLKGLIDALKSQGATFEFLGEENHFPFRMKTCGLHGGEIAIDAGESSQMLSGLLMAAVGADAPTTVKLSGGTVSKPFVKMTLSMMAQFGFECPSDGETFTVKPRKAGAGERVYAIEPDATAASYFATLPAVVGGVSELPNFGGCALQGDAAYVDVLKSLGLVKTAKVGDSLLVFGGDGAAFPETAEVDFNDISDTFLSLAAVAMLLPFKLKITGIGHTRKQETDRVAAVARELRKFCVSVEEGAGDILITPYTRAELLGKLSGETSVETYDDHRIAMSFAIAGCVDIRGDGSPWIKIVNPECTSKTWGEFFEVLYTVREDSRKFRVVAIDGGAAVGKSSVSRECSRILRYMHVDTGAHYRTVAYGLLERGADSSDVAKVSEKLGCLEIGAELEGNSAKITLGGKIVPDSEIRNERINSKVAEYASMPLVREFLKNYQRSMADFARSHGFDGMIMEGRDIGSVIFPDADTRIYLDADEQTRAARRAKEGITDSIKKRDDLDKKRKTAPLVCPEGALRIDTSRMTKDEVVERTLSAILES